MVLGMGKDTVEDMVEDNKQVVDMDKVDNNYYYNNYSAAASEAVVGQYGFW